MVNGDIRDIRKDPLSVTPQNRNPDLASLTTFKLSLEADEKESKSRLHLPYFK